MRYLLPALATVVALLCAYMLGDLSTHHALHPVAAAACALVLVSCAMGAWAVAITPDADLG